MENEPSGYFGRLFSICLGTLLGLSIATGAQAAATVTGSIYTLDGVEAEIEGCDIGLFEDGAGVSSTTTDANGDYTLTAPSTGTFLLMAEASSSGDCYEESGGVVSQEYHYIEDGSTVELPIFGSFPNTTTTIRGRILSPSGAPLADRTITFVSRDIENGSNQQGTTNSTGRFNVTIPAGYYDISLASGFDCFDASNPAGENEACLTWAHRNRNFGAGSLTDLGDLEFEVGDSQAVELLLKEEVSPGVFESITPDSINVNSYQSEDSGVVKLNAPASWYDSSTPSSSIVITAEPDTDWTVDVVAKVGVRVLHGSMIIQEYDLGSSTSVTWDAINSAWNSTLTVPMADFVLTEQFDLDDTSLATLDQTFDPTQENIFTMTNGVVITVPEDAVSGGGTAQIVVEPAFDIGDSYFPSDALSYNMTIYNDSNATVDSFLKPITIVMPYDEAALLAISVLETDLKPWYYNEDNNIWQQIAAPRWSKDETADEITFSVTHFSQYGLLYDRLEDMTNKVTEGNDTAVLRDGPKKIKNVKAQKKLRKYHSLSTSKKRVQALVNVTAKKPTGSVDSYDIRFSKKNGDKKKVGSHKKSKTFRIGKTRIKKASKSSRVRLKWRTGFPLNKNLYYRVRYTKTIGSTSISSVWSNPKKLKIKRSDTGL